jgi:hypothetical protein
VAVTWNRVASGSNWLIYVNGTQAAAGLYSQALGGGNSTDRFVIGGAYPAGWQAIRWFQGRIDNVRVYKRALPAAEVSALATYELSGQAISLHPAIVYYLNLLRA